MIRIWRILLLAALVALVSVGCKPDSDSSTSASADKRESPADGGFTLPPDAPKHIVEAYQKAEKTEEKRDVVEQEVLAEVADHELPELQEPADGDGTEGDCGQEPCADPPADSTEADEQTDGQTGEQAGEQPGEQPDDPSPVQPGDAAQEQPDQPAPGQPEQPEQPAPVRPQQPAPVQPKVQPAPRPMLPRVPKTVKAAVDRWIAAQRAAIRDCRAAAAKINTKPEDGIGISRSPICGTHPVPAKLAPWIRILGYDVKALTQNGA